MAVPMNPKAPQKPPVKTVSPKPLKGGNVPVTGN